MNLATRIQIPDLVKDWPFPRKVNPALEKVKRENDEWTKTLGINNVKLESALKRGGIALLTALCYPDVPAATLQWGADIMTVFLIFDEITDKLSGVEVDGLYEMVKDVFENPDVARPQDECLTGRLYQSFWNRAHPHATPTFLKHFPERCLSYVQSVAQQAHDRDALCVRDLHGYLGQRRQNAGVMPSFAILLHSLAVPDHVLSRPQSGVPDLERLACDLIILANDICSYNVEQSRGDTHNAVAVLMHAAGLPVQDAIEAVARMYDEAAAAFLRKMDQVVTGDCAQSEDVRAYVRGLANWVRGNFEMSFEIERYQLGPEARRGEWIALLPRKG